MSNKFEAAKQIFKGGKYVFETVVPKIAKNLKKRFDTKQEGFKSVDDQLKGTNVDISKKLKKDLVKQFLMLMTNLRVLLKKLKVAELNINLELIRL